MCVKCLSGCYEAMYKRRRSIFSDKASATSTPSFQLVFSAMNNSSTLLSQIHSSQTFWQWCRLSYWTVCLDVHLLCWRNPFWSSRSSSLAFYPFFSPCVQLLAVKSSVIYHLIWNMKKVLTHFWKMLFLKFPCYLSMVGPRYSLKYLLVRWLCFTTCSF